MKLFRATFRFKDTRCTIISDRRNAIQTAIKSIKQNRKALEEYCETHPKFRYTLEPIAAPHEPLVARQMAEEAEKAKVGPMAAVAGVIADLAVEDMIDYGCEVAVVENGGEISAVSNRTIDVAIAAGDSPLSKKLGFRLVDFPVGIATSSGCFSHALSFGEAEAATVFCRNAGLADASATAVCNVVKGKDCQAGIQAGIGKALSIQGVQGVLIMFREFTGTAGKIPQIIKINPDI